MSSIVSIHSFRGGTGKSNLTANIAATLALQGKRVGVVDTDIQSPGIHIIVGLDESSMTNSLNDYLWGRCPISDTAYDVSESVGISNNGPAQSAGAFFLIPASLKTGDIVRILREGYDVARLNDGFQELVRVLELDYLFIDTHPGLNEETLLSISISDILVILLRPDKQDFQGTAVTVDVARQLDVPRLVLVVNKVLGSIDSDDLRSQMQSVFDAEVAGVLPLSEDMARLGSDGIFCLKQPDHPWTVEMQKIAEWIDSGG